MQPGSPLQETRDGLPQCRGVLDHRIDALFPEIRRVREYLHAHPEPSGEETATTQFIREQLPAERFAVRTGPSNRGLIVEPASGPEGPRILLRADIDALPLQDAKEAPYASTRPGVMHACGHDGHTAAVLGAIRALDAAAAANELPWPVPWRAVFQPAEETNRGALAMMEAGALDNVAAALSLHLDPSRAVGTVGVREGAFTAACVELTVTVTGRGGHAARPHEARDPIAAAAQLVNTIYLFVPRSADSRNPVVLSFGQIHGGDTPNAIPDQVVMNGTLRTFGEETCKRTMDHIRQLGRGIAEASDTHIAIDFTEGPPAVRNDGPLTRRIAAEAADLLGPDRVHTIDQPSMGGEDFANYLANVPGAMFRLGCRGAGAPETVLHSPAFDFDPEALSVGAKVLARTALSWSRPPEPGEDA